VRLQKFRVLWQDQNVQGDGVLEPTERKFRSWVLVIAALIGPPLVFLLYYRTMFSGLIVPEALDFAQLGRKLSEGSGFVTNVIRPLALTDASGSNLLRQPDLIHGPLYPVILAIAFGIGGAKDNVVAWVSGLFFLLTVPVVYRLASRVFNRAVALITVLVITFNALMLEYSYSGMPITLEIFLATCLLLVMYNLSAFVRDQEQRGTAAGGRDVRLPKGQLALAGLLLGLLYLTDTIFLWFAPVALVWLAIQFKVLGRMRWRAVLRVAVPLLILILPWMFRYYKLGVNPFFGLRITEIWMNTKDYPRDTAYRTLPGDLAPGLGLFSSVVQKVLLGVNQVIKGFPQVSANWILAFFLPSLLFRFSDPAANRLRQIMILLWFSLMFGMLLFGVQLPLFVTTIPTMLVFSVAYLLYLVRQAQMRWTSISITTALLTIGIIYPLMSAMLLEDKPKDILQEQAAAKGLAKMSQKGDVVFSDMPQIVAWYANRPAITIPFDNAKIKALRRRFEKARFLFLTQNASQYGDAWGTLYSQAAQWNEVYAFQREREAPLPQARTISSAASPLEGFEIKAPIKGGRRVVIMESSGPPPIAPGEQQPAPTVKEPERSVMR
jgi:hypothetical protein